VLVNNAGVIDDGFVMMMSHEKWSRVVDTNLGSTFLCSREALRIMMRNQKTPKPGGAIVNVASIAGIVGAPGQLNYTASKGGMIAFTRGLAKEAAMFSVRANAVAPGFVETEMMREVPRDVVDLYKLATPLQRLGQPEDIAPIVSFLASTRSAYITGQVVAVDGGFSH
jgi:3-oxoacyl-[acyl-carrier protein] reductase